MLERNLIFREVAAFILAGLVLLAALALFTFSPEDPSFNHATESLTLNKAGPIGAYFADILYQLFGFAAWIPLALMLITVVQLAWIRSKISWEWSSLFWLPFIIGSAALLNTYSLIMLNQEIAELPAGNGGALGTMLSNALMQSAHTTGHDILLIVMTLSAFIAASHISVLTLLKKLTAILRWLWQQVQCLLIVMRRRKVKEELRDEQLQEPHIILKSEPEITKAVEVKVSRRAMEARQGELALVTDVGDGYFKLPDINLFEPLKPKTSAHSDVSLQAMARMLEKKLLDYKVEGEVIAVQPGPVVIRFEFRPAPGTKVSRVIALQDDLARAISAISVRVAGNIPGKNAIGIEIPNTVRETVLMREVLASPEFCDKKKGMPLALGVDIAGNPIVADLIKMPHLLVAGTTGSGKSVSVNGMICSMLMTYTPADLRLIMVDPKMLELSMYNDIPHLLVPVVTNPGKAAKALAWAVYEMERRYQLLSEAKVRNVSNYNKIQKELGEESGEHLPYIVVIIDELADLMMVAGKEVEQSICRLAQKARAAGIHLILATQRPSVDVITGLIKANLPSRIAFQVSSRVDSRTILDEMGAEQLLGYGDSLCMIGGRNINRVHGAFIDDNEVIALVEHLKTQGEPEYREEVFHAPSASEDEMDVDEERDEKYDEAADMVIRKGQCSVSMVQRNLRIGYNRASRIVEMMEHEGLVTPPGAGGTRKVLSRSQDEGGGVIE
ncbi:MAG: DNA translocase FtsK 4TM domain-containing protein [Mariprofundaceae bacterium]